jgi:hypothetical protein
MRMMTHKKNSALREWQEGITSYSLFPSRLIIKTRGFFGEKTTQLPLSQFQGVAIKTDVTNQLALYLVGCACVEHIMLDRVDEDEIIAVWRGLCAKTQLSLLIEHEDGTLLPAQKRLGALVIAHKQRRRRGFATLNSRRPNAPMRRKSIMKALAKSA